MEYTMKSPCDQCPFLKKMRHGFSIQRLEDHARGEFPCHQTAECDEETGEFNATEKSVHCAGALIYLEKRKRPHQMMRITERLGMYNHKELDKTAFKKVR